MDFSSLEATDSVKKQKARDRLLERVKLGAKKQEAAIKKALDTVIVDRIWYPNKMRFSLQVKNNEHVPVVYYDAPGQKNDPANPVGEFFIHKHAIGQMADVLEIARNYVTKLRTSPNLWKRELLVHILNEHFQKEVFMTARNQPIGYLRRAVGNEVRGFQGRNFGRNMATAPLLKTFVENCAGLRAGPVAGDTSDLMTTLKCVLPYVFEPINGEFIAFGVSFANSDFGVGKLAVGGFVMRISSGTTAVLENMLSKVHIGKILDSDDELTLSEDTMNKELAAHQGAVRDSVIATLSPEAVKKSLDMIVKANAHGIEWFKLRTTLSKALTKKELELVKSLLENGDDLMDLPPVVKDSGGYNQATSWWAANVIGWFAQKEESVERQKDLQELAGEVLAL
jgi:hypothetical protein